MSRTEANLALAQVGLEHLQARKIYGWWEIYDTRFSGQFPVKHHSLTVVVGMVKNGLRPLPFPNVWNEYKELRTLFSQDEIDRFNEYNQQVANVAGVRNRETKEFTPFDYKI